MYQLVYISSARRVSDAELDDILDQSRSRNRRDEISGFLLFNGQRFLQVLEGPEAIVERTYARIKRDPRHRAPVILSARSVDQRQFGNWDMAFDRLTTGTSRTLEETVDAFVAGITDPNLRALFSGYVRLRSAA